MTTHDPASIEDLLALALADTDPASAHELSVDVAYPTTAITVTRGQER